MQPPRQDKKEKEIDCVIREIYQFEKRNKIRDKRKINFYEKLGPH